MGANQLEETAVFGEFAPACSLAILPDTVESRQPPEPDILCELGSGEKLAFELVSADDVTSDKARPGGTVSVTKYFKDSLNLQLALGEAFSRALAADKISSPERFHYHFVNVYFDDFATFRQSSRGVTAAIELLNELGPGRHLVKKDCIRVIDCEPYPLPCSYEGPIFSANSSTYCVAPAVVERIRGKLGKRYTTEHPIHLLVWSHSAIAAEVAFWRDDLLRLIKTEGMGPFDHLWVFGCGRREVVFDLAK